MTVVTVEREFHGKKISIETGKVAKQAAGAVIVRSGDSVVLVAATLGADKGFDFLPLTIDYIEKAYAAGRIPGGYFKREGKLTDREVLTSRLIDRPCRPLFPEGFSREIQIMATVLSFDPEANTDMLAMCGASAALMISEIPFNGPVAGVRIGRRNGKVVLNPSDEELAKGDLNFILAGSKDAIMMVEGGAQQAPEQEVLDALFFGHKEMQTLIEMQEELREKAGKPKIDFAAVEKDSARLALEKSVAELATPKLKIAINTHDKHERSSAIKAVRDEVVAQLVAEGSEDAEAKTQAIKTIYGDLQYEVVRRQIVEEKLRIDGRDTKTVRPISIELGVLPRVHGSTLFTRGETQAIVALTLGVESEAQRIESLEGTQSKPFMLHYNFPPFCVGEAKPIRGPGRREVGHGALAERAVEKILPTAKEWPYVMRVVSEITESNGSSSMASVCGASLALMDAGVPIKAPVAGVAMGLIKEGEKYAVLTDILGDEDHLGDMDFKVCGTEQGITALQMDIKISGLSQAIFQEAMEQAKQGRLHILSKMNEAISAPRGKVSDYAPRIVSIKIAQDKIRDLIGPGGKMIKSIAEAWDVIINVEDSGEVRISGSNSYNLEQAEKVVKSITEKAEIGRVYRGIVKRVVDFGAFVEILPGTEGLVHISQLAEGRVREVTDVTNEGDELMVKVLEMDRMGKIRLSHIEALRDMQEEAGGEAVA
jgi:polyribonucleotide nucleotidyltransferase